MKLDDFVATTAGRLLDVTALSSAYSAFRPLFADTDRPVLVDEVLASDIFRVIDHFDHDGDQDTIASELSLQMAECVSMALGQPIDSSADIWNQLASYGSHSIAAKQQCHWYTRGCRGIGVYYGDHSAFDEIGESTDSMDVKVERALQYLPPGWRLTSIDYMKAYAVGPHNQTTLLKESSCIGWVLDNTRSAYVGVSLKPRWNEIIQSVRRAGVTGDALCRELQKDCWTAIRFSKYSLPTDRRGEYYEGVRIDDVIGNFALPASQAKLSALELSPFFVGMFDRGYHTFVGLNGLLSEFHWGDLPTQMAIECTPFRERGGDGLLMVPPGIYT
jgi:hypothetical protein